MEQIDVLHWSLAALGAEICRFVIMQLTWKTLYFFITNANKNGDELEEEEEEEEVEDEEEEEEVNVPSIWR